eukprot:TRINITY_DN20500_c0_g1_i1.p1 TRINITY_DN20500_c0_g1~~TRINITY_DN20500_c0_g1_i1.p1  ORF type:complete len:343 (+),score=69.03 TRINITY_DN20500_c0_g1_i1:127-1155(+)
MTASTYSAFCSDVKQCIQNWHKKQSAGYNQPNPLESLEKIIRSHGGVAEAVGLMAAAKVCEDEGTQFSTVQATCLGQAGVLFMETELERYRLGLFTMDQDLQRSLSCIKRATDIYIAFHLYTEAHSLSLFAADSLLSLQCEDSAASFYMTAAGCFPDEVATRGDGRPANIDNQLREYTLLKAFECQIASWNKSAALKTAESILKLAPYQYSYGDAERDERECDDDDSDGFFEEDSATTLPADPRNSLIHLPDAQRERIAFILVSVILVHVACNDLEKASLLLPRLRSVSGSLFRFISSVVASPRDVPLKPTLLRDPIHIAIYQKVVTSVMYPSSYPRDDASK